MIARSLFLVVLIGLYPSSECEKDCKTTVTVVDCDGAGVAGARVQIKVCCSGGSDVEAVTDPNGQATFNYCPKDICGSRVVLSGFAEQSFNANSCHQEGKTSNCTIKICKRP